MAALAHARLALFCSGGGSNAQSIIDYFKGHPRISVQLLVASHPGAYALNRAQAAGIETLVLPSRAALASSDFVQELQQRGITHIILAGFLWLVPPALIAAFPQRIINIHPALLPAFGGKGMYGHHVHQAVKDAGHLETGLTIHLVDEHYDHGRTLRQVRVPLTGQESPDEIAALVLAQEHAHYAQAIEQYIEQSAG